MKPLVRILLVAVALTMLFGMGVDYTAQYEANTPYPTNGEIALQADHYVGDQIYLVGTVQSVDAASSTITIQITHSEGATDLTVSPADVDVSPSGVVQVYGTLDADRQVAAEAVRVVNPAGSSRAYKYGVSAVGALLVVILFFKHWSVDPATLTFVGRYDG